MAKLKWAEIKVEVARQVDFVFLLAPLEKMYNMLAHVFCILILNTIRDESEHAVSLSVLVLEIAELYIPLLGLRNLITR